MEIPMFHNCQMLSKENATLSTKYKTLTRKFKELQKTLLVLQEDLMVLRANKCFCEANHSENSKVIHRPASLTQKPEDVSSERKRMLELHNSLLKRLEKESKLSAKQTKNFNKLQMENEKLNDDLFNSKQQIEYLNKQLDNKDQQIQINNENLGHHDGRKFLLKEKKRLLSENKKLKDELKGLDDSFFEEVEDMKYALQQSAKLNRQYEKVIKSFCEKYGVRYKDVVGTNSKKLL